MNANASLTVPYPILPKRTGRILIYPYKSDSAQGRLNDNIYNWPSIQSEAAIRSGVYASFASLMKFGGSSSVSEAPQTWTNSQNTTV